MIQEIPERICKFCGEIIVPGDDPGQWCHLGGMYWIHCGEDGEGENIATPAGD